MPKTFEQARAENELVPGTPGASQTQITGDEVVGAWLTGAVDAGWTFTNLKEWVKLDADWMSKSVYDSGGDGRVDNAEQLADGTNTVTASEARGHIDNTTIHFLINDSSTATNVAWSGSKINSEITSLNSAIASKENDLGTPSSNGQVLKSTIGKVRTWENDLYVPPGGIEDQIIVKNSATEQDADWSNIPLAFASSWKFDSSTSATDPGAESFKLNASTQAATTAVYLSYTNVNGLNLKEILLSLPAGERFAIWEQNDSDRAVLYEISGAIVDETTWCRIPVTFVDRATLEFRNGRTCNFQFFGLSTGTDLSDAEFPTYAVFDSKVSAGAAVDFSSGNKQEVNASTNSTLTVTSPTGHPANFTLVILNSGSLISISSASEGAIQWDGGTPPTWAGKSVLTLYYDGSTWHGSAMVSVS